MAGVTAKEIAARLGLSASAVSLALNNKPGVSRETRRQVFEAAAKMGYNGLKAPSMAAARKRLCFVFYVNKLVSIAENTTFSSFVLQGVESAASALGYSTQLRYLRAGESIERQAADICRDVDGIVLLGTDIIEESLPEIDAFLTAASALPLVVVDSFMLAGRLDCVGNDNAFGSRQAVEYLMSRGCRSIGYLRSRHRILNFEEREAGLLAALAAAGLKPAEVVDMGISFDDAIVDMDKYLSAHKTLPDGFFAENDVIAAAAIRAMKARGIELPAQVSVVGFDDIPICDLTNPSLTTVRAFKEQLGEVAVRLLDQRLQARQGTGEDTCAGRLRVALSTQLHIRNSVK